MTGTDLRRSRGVSRESRKTGPLKRRFDHDVEELLGFPVRWEPDQIETGQYVFSLRSPTGPHTSDGLGYGVLGVLHLVAALLSDPTPTTICVDEPEISLHPQVQRRVAEYLARMAAHTQIVVATHSAYFANPEWLVSGAEFVRCFVTAGTIQFGAVSESSRAKLSKMMTDMNNPHLLGLDAREVFFAGGDRTILVVEGQEDALLIRRYLTEAGIDGDLEVFGWGAGGASKIPLVLAILEDLGISNIATLVDGDMAELHKSLKANHPTGRHAMLPTDDIRDKPQRSEAEAKVGMFNSNGTLKPEFAERFEETMQSLT